MARKHRFESGALRRLYDRFIGDDPARREEYDDSALSARVAMQIYELRLAAGFTQDQLARRVGTSVSAISRLESADYQGHSLAMLRRIAAAMDRQLEIRFVSVQAGRRSAMKKAAKKKVSRRKAVA